jgi:hypothetical protein
MPENPTQGEEGLSRLRQPFFVVQIRSKKTAQA